MELRGRVENGVVVPMGDLGLPEGAEVVVCFPPAVLGPCNPSGRVRLPLVPSRVPGGRMLTSERVAELLDGVDGPA